MGMFDFLHYINSLQGLTEESYAKRRSLTCAITSAAGVNSHKNVPLVLPPPPECSEIMSVIMDKSRLRLKPKSLNQSKAR